ncbi:M1 family metallopeptidase [Streptomyces sp. NBC_00015]|uniref:M1 family metallopeptidase n=1 Tax=unclassified Streptomyces TaxID=2593676 RepID=UPI00225BB655|nr:M1 family metallopeptidase [Streptomyces sp. NBC_00103]MCX5372977.1 M1 family metallopeptidase [Streptomyces sp. NBC_00103]
MSRSVRLVPAVAAAVLLLALTACDDEGAPDTAGARARDVSGAPGVGDPYFPKAGNGGYDVSHYGLTLAYTADGNRLTGTAVVTARATEDLAAFDLDLAGMKVEEVTVEGDKAGFRRDGQELIVRPPGALSDGETFEVRVRYSGSPRTITDPDGSKEGWLRTADGALALGEPTGSMAWFPGNHHPSDKASYDIAVTVPKGLTAVSNGELRSARTADDGRTTFTWHTAEPMASYVATLAIGRYTVTRSATQGGLPVYVAVDPSQVTASRKVLARLPEVMEWAENNFGPYPFSSTGAIVDRPEDVEYALETQNRPVYPGAPDTATLVHETAHQWFGDSVTPKSWQDMWLNESLATYAEWLWTEDEGGATAEETFTELYDHGEDEYEDLWAFPPAKPTSAAHVSDTPVYQRGAMVIHRIRQAVGDDTFYDIVQGWAAAHRHGSADTDDFTAFVEKQAPDEDFDEIWADWLYGEGKPARP